MGTSSFFDLPQKRRIVCRPQTRKKLRLYIAATGAWRFTPLAGSEMCIRDRLVSQPPRAARHEAECGFLKKEAEPLF